MSDRSWKAFERRIAARHGGKRIPVTGERAGADCDCGMFAVQCKLGRGMPSYLQDWLDGIRAAGARRDKIGIIVWKPKGARDNDAIVVLSLRDWTDLHGNAPSEPHEVLS